MLHTGFLGGDRGSVIERNEGETRMAQSQEVKEFRAIDEALFGI